MRFMRSMLLLFFTVCLSLSFPAHAAANENRGKTPNVKLQNLTPADSPLSFKFQKIRWKYDRIRFWGVVTNDGPDDYQYVSVSFTALDANGNFLGRAKTFCDPSDLKAGESGNIDNWSLDTDEQLPAIIQFKVSGSPD